MAYIQPSAPATLTSPRYGSKAEARKVRRLIRALAKAGFRVHSVDVPGEGTIHTPNERAAVCEVFEWVGGVTLRFVSAGAPSVHYRVQLVQGNGEDDIVSDWSSDLMQPARPGTFDHAVTTFLDNDDTREV